MGECSAHYNEAFIEMLKYTEPSHMTGKVYVNERDYNTLIKAGIHHDHLVKMKRNESAFSK